MSDGEAHSRKCYGQECPVARALDVVGDRWTMLILRELLGGPSRFYELEAGLPGIAKNLLTKRLRQLEGDGVIRRVTVHGATLYTLTPEGEAIRPTIEHLGFWGTKIARIGPVEHDRSIRAIAMALHAIFARAGDALPARPWTIDLDVEDEHLEVVLGPRPTVTARTSSDPDARLRVPKKTLTDFLGGRGLRKRAFVHVSGDREARASLLHVLDVM